MDKLRLYQQAKKTAREISLNTRYRQRHFHCRWFTLFLLGIVWGISGAQSPTADTNLDQARNNLNQVKSRIESIQSRLRQQDSNRNAIARNLESSERKAAQLVLEGRRLATVRSRLNASQRELRDTASRLRQQRQFLQHQLARQLRVAYALGREGRLKLILNGQDPEDVPRLLRYHDYFSRNQRQRIQELSAAQQRLHSTLNTIEKQNLRLTALAERQERQARELARERDLRAVALAQSEQRLKTQRQRLAVLQKNERRLTELVKALHQAIDDIPADLEPPKSFRALRGKLPWPIQGRLIRRYGERSKAGDRRTGGVVLSAREGLEVRAITHGRVVFADWLRGFGQLIIIDHGGGYMSLYGYNQSLLREPGEWVNAGDSIATVGDSGGQAENGLYFEIRRAGQTLNPGRWCSARARFKSAAL